MPATNWRTSAPAISCRRCIGPRGYGLAKDQAQLNNTNADLQRIISHKQHARLCSRRVSRYAKIPARWIASHDPGRSGHRDRETAETQFDFATITSPISGIAEVRMIDAGNMITPSDPGLVVINQLEPISVVFTVPSEAISHWAVGRPTSIVSVTARSPDNARPLGTGGFGFQSR